MLLLVDGYLKNPGIELITAGLQRKCVRLRLFGRDRCPIECLSRKEKMPFCCGARKHAPDTPASKLQIFTLRASNLRAAPLRNFSTVLTR